MKIEPAILAPYLKAAAVDQLAFDLETQGFTVKRKGTGSDDERHFDLVARRGGETGFYVVRVAGQRHGPQEMPLSMLTKDLRLKNGRFHLVVVRPERGTDVSVSGLADALRRSLSSDQTGELRRSSNHLSVEGVDGVEIERIEVRHGGEIDVTGTAVLTLSQAAEQAHGEPAREQVPFGFRAAIGPDGSVLNDPAPEYKFDWSEWREEQVEGMGLSRDG